MRWRWDVDDEQGTAAFEITTTRAEQDIGQEVASEFARSLDRAGVRTSTIMLRTRTDAVYGLVTVLWTGEVSDPTKTRYIFGAYERALPPAHESNTLG